jgi:hypothetical protein
MSGQAAGVSESQANNESDQVQESAGLWIPQPTDSSTGDG